MEKHISSAEYRYIPIEHAIEIARLRETIRKLIRENIKLKMKVKWSMYDYKKKDN